MGEQDGESELSIRTAVAVLAGGASLLGPDVGAAATALAPAMSPIISLTRLGLPDSWGAHRSPIRRRSPPVSRLADYESARSSRALTVSYLHKWLARHPVQFPLDRVFAKWHARCGLAAIDRH